MKPDNDTHGRAAQTLAANPASTPDPADQLPDAALARKSPADEEQPPKQPAPDIATHTATPALLPPAVVAVPDLPARPVGPADSDLPITFPTPEAMLLAVAEPEQILAVFPCKIEKVTKPRGALLMERLKALFTWNGLVKSVGIAVLIAIFSYWQNLSPWLERVQQWWKYLLGGLGVIVFAWRWFQGRRTGTEAMVVTATRLLFVQGVSQQMPDTRHSYETVTVLELVALVQARKKPTSEELRFRSRDGSTITFLPTGSGAGLARPDLGYYTDNVISYQDVIQRFNVTTPLWQKLLFGHVSFRRRQR